MHSEPKRFGPFALDTATGVLTRGGADVTVGGRALLLLQALVEAQGRLVEKAALLELGWPGLVVEESNLSVQIAALRKVLGPREEGSDWIVTVARRGYRLNGTVSDSRAANGAADNVPLPVAVRPSVGVLPFRNLSDDPAQEYFANGITDDVIAALTRFRWFTVAGRSPSYAYSKGADEPGQAGLELGVRYVVRGSVRKSGDKVRIAAELVDTVPGHCLWADHYDFDLQDVFMVQDRIARRVAGSIEPELLQSETGSIASRPRTASSNAWDLVAQGCWHFHKITRPTHEKAQELFREARRLDAQLVEADIWLARANAGVLAFGWTEVPGEVAKEGLEAALRAVRADEKNGYAHYALAIMSVFCESFDVAIRSGERAVELVPSFALGHLVFGTARLYSGDAQGAVAALEEGLELNRHDPHNFIWYNQLALALLFSGSPETALSAAHMSLTVRPQWRPAMEILAGASMALQRHDAAREWKARAARVERPSGDSLQVMWRNNPEWAKRMQEWLSD